MKSILFLFFLLPTFVSGQIITTIAGNGTRWLSGDGGPASAAGFEPGGMIIDSIGNIYFSDHTNHRIRKINSRGIISTIAGIGYSTYPWTVYGAGFSGDGSPATNAQLADPFGLAKDAKGNIYFIDAGNSRIRKIDTYGIITTVVGNGSSGFSGDGGPATSAEFNTPWHMEVDKFGNLYIADNENRRIRKVDTLGTIRTIAGKLLGTPGHYYSPFSGDGGPATNATFATPWGIKVDSLGNIYIVDGESNCIRKIDTNGIINTIAGIGDSDNPGSFAGDGGSATAARLNLPTEVAFDNIGNMYISDVFNYRIRKVNTSGIITTIAGNGIKAYHGDGGPATNASFDDPNSVAVDRLGNVYVSERKKFTIRKITMPSPYFPCGHIQALNVCENSTAASINLLLAVNDTNIGLTETWSILDAGYHGTLIASYSTTSTGGTLIPAGLSYTPTSGYSGSDSFKIKVTNGIDSDYTTIYVTVNPLPFVGTISGASVVCTGSSTTLIDTVLGGIWNSSDATIGAIDSTGIVCGIATGDVVISYSITNSCGTNYAFDTISVITVPYAGIIDGSSIVCISDTLLLVDTVVGGFWSSSNPSATVSSGIVSGISAGIDTISYIVSNICGSSIATKVITVSTFPTVDSIHGIDSIIEGDVSTLIDSSPGGFWLSSDTTILLVDSTGNIAAISPGVCIVYYMLSNDCGSDTASHPITVEVAPSPPTTGLGLTIDKFPNPSSGSFSVTVWSKAIEAAHLEISDMGGSKIKSIETITNKSTPISIDAFSGIYFIHAKTNHGTNSTKVIIAK